MSRIYLIVAGLFVFAGLLASLFAPTENMGAQEAFYAHLILIAPPLFVGTVISALAVIIDKFDQLLGKKSCMSFSLAVSEQEKNEDFGSLFAEKLREDQTSAPSPFEPQMQPVFEDMVMETPAPSAFEPPAADKRRAPTVDEFIVKGSEGAESASSSRLAREGTFAGRNYRMYEDGSLEIDTDQSTIRFDSLDEFRSFVSSAAAG